MSEAQADYKPKRDVLGKFAQDQAEPVLSRGLTPAPDLSAKLMRAANDSNDEAMVNLLWDAKDILDDSNVAKDITSVVERARRSFRNRDKSKYHPILDEAMIALELKAAKPR